jgi:hypothetical protein
MEGIIDLHHDIMFFLIWIIILVSFFLFEFVIGNLKESFSKFKRSELVFEDIQHSEDILPTRIQHNTVLEII